MRRTESRSVRRIALAFLALLVTASCGSQTWSIEDVVHVLPDYLPDGWALGSATERIGTAEGLTGKAIEISDYTVVWLPDELVGTTRDEAREAILETDNDPSIFINVGSRYYEDIYLLAFGAPLGEVGGYDENTPLMSEDHINEPTFRVECCVVILQAIGVDEHELRRVAAGMFATDRQSWRAQLGDRLLLDEQTG